MFQDLRYALRQLLKSPGFALTAVLTLALGIGANTAIFTLMDSIVLRPLPFPRQDRLMAIQYEPGRPGVFPKGWIRALAERSESFASVSGFGADAESNVTESGSSERVFGAQVMTNALDTLGVRPTLGRFFSPENAIAGQDRVVILSDGYWRQRFGANPGVIGEPVRIDGISRRIIGVMPAAVRFPYADTRFVIPAAFKGGDPLDPWSDFSLRAFGKLKDHVTPSAAQAELRRLHGILLPLFPWRMPDVWASEMTVVSLLDAEVGSTRPRLLLLLGTVGIVLLIACFNVANLMLARSVSRNRELSIRSALGASTLRLVRQLLSESIVLALLAGVVGLAGAAFSLRGLVHLLPVDTPRVSDVSLDWPVFLFSVGVSVVTGIVFGLIPAVKMSAPDLQRGFSSGSRGVAGSAAQFRVSMALVMGQVGLSVVVIIAAGLMTRSLYRLSQVDPGFRTDRIVTAEVALDANACDQKGRCRAFFEAVLDSLRGAGAGTVALSDALPLMARGGNYVYDAQGHPRESRQGAFIATGRMVSPDYFKMLGLRLVRGRLLSGLDASGTSRAVVINEHMAERLWPHENPLGKSIINVGDEPAPAIWNRDAAREVVGVVGNSHDQGTLAGEYDDQVWLPIERGREQPVMYVLLRTQADARNAAGMLREAVAAIDPLVPVTHVRSLNEVVATSISAPRSLAILVLAFGALALVIGGVGVYSLIAYVVSWRTREIGIRLALGATPREVMMAVVRQSLILAAGGSLVGLAASGLLTRLLRGFLFGVSSLDPLTFCAAPLLMFVLALVAAWVPARRAANVDPIQTLRHE